MDKQQVISFIEGQLITGKISKVDLLDIANNRVVSQGSTAMASDNVTVSTRQESSKNLINTFYSIGAIIAIIGVGILIAQHWNEIGFVGRISVTLGISLFAYILGLLLNKPQQKMVSQVMFTIAAALVPIGSYVLLKEANITFDWTSQTAVALISTLVFGSALLISKKNILFFITVGFATWTYYAFILKVFGYNYYSADFLKWSSMLLGISYLFIAYGYRSVFKASDKDYENEKKAIQDFFSGLGTLAILGAGIFIGGIFDLLYIALIFGAFYGSVYLKSRSMLTFGALFLMAHIIKLTSKYFVDSIGWPVALIVIGFFVIGVGYMTYYLNKRFITSK